MASARSGRRRGPPPSIPIQSGERGRDILRGGAGECRWVRGGVGGGYGARGGPVGAGGLAQLGHGPGGFLLLLFFFLFGFLFFFPFVFSFIISFLFKSFNPFSHFIKICPLHYNYLCNIRQPPNNFILNFENFYCFHQFEF